ncbi:MAG: SURF1 family protein [Tabrizicola sp.]|uniref:SURF1 family protein n=1 Tax=Tabrizicola sp. TaxID=2005166 RepID=UPI0027371DB9|nr:SURF1 family protein [Tabrizicola sp.]MDP3263823.1 SURF1 family protein [Tabrizicola sp.]MDP3647187.1 SURF1 family protein [Paracoccaceae bacterium]MDZ4067737.1 SURF1 family protein [Tabrizicola sp.]
MIRSVAFAVILGLAGAGVLVSLGVWQLHRLEWKEAIIARAEARMAEAPITLPAMLDPVADRYRAVTATGRFTGEEAHVLTSTREMGPGFLVIAAFETGGRRILIDRGFVPETEKTTPRPPSEATVVGNLNWPDDVNSSTPPYDADRQIWYGRDLGGIASLLGTEPVLVIAREHTGDSIIPQPVTTAGFRNDHFNYAVTWFSLAAVWLGMTLYLLWRIRARSV